MWEGGRWRMKGGGREDEMGGRGGMGGGGDGLFKCDAVGEQEKVRYSYI